jgi:hypothetical protein
LFAIKAHADILQIAPFSGDNCPIQCHTVVIQMLQYMMCCSYGITRDTKIILEPSQKLAAFMSSFLDCLLTLF